MQVSINIFQSPEAEDRRASHHWRSLANSCPGPHFLRLLPKVHRQKKRERNIFFLPPPLSPILLLLRKEKWLLPNACTSISLPLPYSVSRKLLHRSKEGTHTHTHTYNKDGRGVIDNVRESPSRKDITVCR